MTRRRCGLLASFIASTGAAATVAASGCSSSSSGASPGTTSEAGSEASLEDVPVVHDGGTYKLQWLVQPFGGNIGYAPEAGAAEAGSDGGSDDGATEAAPEAGGNQGDGSVPGLEGVKVCVDKMPSIACVMTAADGQFTLEGLPALTSMALTLNKTGYQPTLLSIQTASTDMDERQYPIGMSALTDGGGPPIGTAVDLTTKGALTLFILGHSPSANGDFAGEPGATATLTPMSGVGPFYLSGGGIVPGATAFTTGGVQALYFNLDPGMYTITYHDPNPQKDCEGVLFPFDSRGIVGPMGSHQVSFPVLAGYMTANIGEICTMSGGFVPTDGGSGG